MKIEGAIKSPLHFKEIQVSILKNLENLAAELEQAASTIRKSLPSVREAHRVIQALKVVHNNSISTEKNLLGGQWPNPENAGVTLIRKIWNAGPGEYIPLTQEEMDLLRRTKSYDRIGGIFDKNFADKAVPPTPPSRER